MHSRPRSNQRNYIQNYVSAQVPNDGLVDKLQSLQLTLILKARSGARRGERSDDDAHQGSIQDLCKPCSPGRHALRSDRYNIRCDTEDNLKEESSRQGEHDAPSKDSHCEVWGKVSERQETRFGKRVETGQGRKGSESATEETDFRAPYTSEHPPT